MNLGGFLMLSKGCSAEVLDLEPLAERLVLLVLMRFANGVICRCGERSVQGCLFACRQAAISDRSPNARDGLH
jgi:hypothetical protein